ncbi:hypothetical protein RHO15_01000 [Utexia brackfieldae]|uniref:hypothetical protein n=1 Tax=Utexia brackfieldae TaxID=3074108 RepID=UPI00370CFCCC
MDENGYVYVKLPYGVKYVDVLFDHQKEKRAWYYDVPLQILGGARDAVKSNLDLAFELLQTRLLIDRFDDYINPNQIALGWLTSDKSLAETISGQYRFIYTNLDKFNNPIELPAIASAETKTGAMARGVSQFLTDFIPAFKSLKFLKPLGRFSKYGQGVAADMIAGALADVLLKSLRVFKYAHFKSLYTEIRTKNKYRLEAVSHENHNAYNYQKLKEALHDQNTNNMA